MEYRILGRTGVRVSAYSLGTMMFGHDGNTDENECIKIVHSALDAGINMIDTSDTYSAGQSEEIVGKAIKGRRDNIFLATKFSLQFGEGLNQRGTSRYWIMKEVENSLRRLQTDHIDLYQIHRPDLDTDMEDTLDALTDLVHQGKIRYFGSSTFPGWYLSETNSISRLCKLNRLSTETSPYSVFVRSAELETLPAVQHFGMGFIAWSPLNGGWLTGKYRKNQELPADSRANRVLGAWGEHYPQLRPRWDMTRPGNVKKLDMVEKLIELASDSGMSLTQMALAFPLAHPAVTAVNIGPRTFSQFEDLKEGFGVTLSDSILDAIDQLNPIGEAVEYSDRGWSAPWSQKWLAKDKRRISNNK